MLPIGERLPKYDAAITTGEPAPVKTIWTLEGGVVPGFVYVIRSPIDQAVGEPVLLTLEVTSVPSTRIL